MDFAFSPDQELLRGAARGFLDERVTSAVVRALWDDPRGESEALWKDMAGLGWLGLGLPESQGGGGLGMVETAILLEELGRVAWPGPYLEIALASRALLAGGTEAQRRRWLPAIAAGDARATVCLLDEGSDWDPAATVTRAEAAPAGSGTSPPRPGRFVSGARSASSRGPTSPTSSWSRRARRTVFRCSPSRRVRPGSP